MSSLYMACRRGSGTPQLESSLVSNNIVYDGTSSERDGMWTLENLKPWDQLEDCARVLLLRRPFGLPARYVPQSMRAFDDPHLIKYPPR